MQKRYVFYYSSSIAPLRCDDAFKLRQIIVNSFFKSVKSGKDINDAKVANKEDTELDSCANFFNPKDPNAKRNLCKAFSNLAKLCPKTCNLKHS